MMGVRKQGDRYLVDWRAADGKRYRRSFRTQKAADKHLREAIDQREEGILPVHGSGLLAEFIVEWEQTVYPTLRENTKRGYQGAIKNHILPGLGDVKLRKLDQRIVQDWVNTLAATLDARTVEYQFAVLSTMLKLASEYGLCRPVLRAGRGRAGVRLPKKIVTRRTPPTVAQIEQLADAIDDRYSAMVRLAGYCGLRQSECFGLHPSAVDFENHRIYVRRTVEHATGAIIDLTKNGRDRTVTMLGPVEASLRDHLAAYPCADFVFHHRGRRLDSSWFHRWAWNDARVAVGLPKLWFHDLRHAAPSVMAQYGGWGPKKVQQEMGHHSASFTLDRYSHLFAENEDSARVTLNDALAVEIERAKTTSLTDARTEGE